MSENVLAALVVLLAALPLVVLGLWFRGERGPKLLETSGPRDVRDRRALATFVGHGLLRIGGVHLLFAAALPVLARPQVLVAALVFAGLVVALALHLILGLLQRRTP